MKKRYSEEQIIKAIKQHEAGAKVDDICRELGISNGTFYNWRSKYAGLEVNEAKRLRELEMKPYEAAEYDRYSAVVAAQVGRMRRALREHQTRVAERVWLKGRPQGELDEARLVDGITGATAIYKQRGPATSQRGRRRVSMRFVMDLSGSMYTFERLDVRSTAHPSARRIRSRVAFSPLRLTRSWGARRGFSR